LHFLDEISFNFSHNSSSSLDSFLGSCIFGIIIKSPYLAKIHQDFLKPFQLTTILSPICNHLGIFTFIFQLGWSTSICHHKTAS
jgi:hypothetical protein